MDREKAIFYHLNKKKIVLLGLVVAFIFCGFGWFGRKREKPPRILKQYEQQRVVKDSKGNLYQLPDLYGGEKVPVMRSSDDGKSWVTVGSARTYLTYSAWGSSLIIDREDNLYLSWSGVSMKAHTQEDLLYRFKAIFFSKSTDGGKNWGEQIVVNNKEAAGMHPVIFTDSRKYIYMCWYKQLRRGMMYFSFSSDGGKNWSEVEELRSGEDAIFSEDSNGVVYLTYVGGEKKNIIFISYSKDGGKNWHTETTGELPVLVKEPYATRFGNTIYLIFRAWVPNIFEVMPDTKLTFNLYYVTSKDEGKTWSQMIKIEEKRREE